MIDKYNMFEDVRKSFKKEGPNIVKDFIKVGLDFVRGHPDADQLEINIRAYKHVEENE